MYIVRYRYRNIFSKRIRRRVESFYTIDVAMKRAQYLRGFRYPNGTTDIIGAVSVTFR